MNPAFFEGPEKKVELAVVDGFPSLRERGHDYWSQVVRAARAQVISVRSNDVFDAYLLSESSLFVYDNFLTMITCGRTRLVDAVLKVLEDIPANAVDVCFYERKHEHFPQQQPTSFYEDARVLRDRLGGRAVQFGAEHEHAVYLFHTDRQTEPDPDDVTIEVLMHGIDERCAEAFRNARAPEGGSLAASLGLHKAVPGAEIDEYVFQPAGYSLNGMLERFYLTIHVTPDPVGSYVSFESNADFRADPSGFVARVIEPFRPEAFDVVGFVPDSRPISVAVPGYRLRRHIQERVSGYHVTFQHFYRPSPAPVRALVFDLGSVG